MPPAISDDEKSDVGGDVAVPVTSKRASEPKEAEDTHGDDVDDAMPDAIANGNADDANNNDGAGDDGNDDDDDEEGEDLDEDEYIVEKILSHVCESDGSLKFKVKWEGYEKKADQTWEDEENLRENAAEVLDDYLSKQGGRDKIVEQAEAGLKSKKRGRPSTGTPTNGTKRRRNGDHPADSTPPASGNARAWKPPAGTWEDEIESIDACHDENTSKLMVYLTWKNGHKTQHDTKVIYQRCPQKMLQFYERHVKIVMAESAKDE
ncbi:heterochromatin protein one [Xylariaceae sp. FL0804]|nr:heterochromatin protein one [Xylariaceae sp. FL0804]